MKAVMYGGGNIGRGFIGMLFSMSGYEVTFIDVAEPVIEGLNREKKYPVILPWPVRHRKTIVRTMWCH